MSAQPLVYWPAKYNSLAIRVNELAKEWEAIGGYGDMHCNGDEKRANEIDDEWDSLMGQFLYNKPNTKIK